MSFWSKLLGADDAYYKYKMRRLEMLKIINTPGHPEMKNAQAWLDHTDAVLRAFWFGEESP